MSSTTSAGSPLGWRKCSYSFQEANCVEWRKSSHSAFNGDCTETALLGEMIAVRDSKQAPRPGCEGPEGPHLEFTLAAWRKFTEGIKDV